MFETHFVTSFLHVQYPQDISTLGCLTLAVLLCRDYCEGLRDSLDLVPIGAWYGQGRKTGWFSPFLMAAWDPEKEEYQSVCRCMSGFTDVFYTEVSSPVSHCKQAIDQPEA